MTNAVIYARYSSHSQREESIEAQLRRCREYAVKNDFNVVAEYCDRALTGKTDHRHEFQRMIKDSEKGHFQAVIMYTIDRFARNRYDSAMYKAKLKKNGVKCYYTEQSLTDEPESIILEAVLEGMAEYYSENLARGVRRGMRENAMKCMVNGSHMLLGYKKGADGKYEIDPATAHIVKEIFNLYSSGKSQSQVVEILNSKGYRTSRGYKFHISAVNTVLKNEKYIGIYKFEDIRIENGVPAIISKDIFNKVQSMLTKNKRKTGKMTDPCKYLLTGKLFCGHSGGAMQGVSGTSHTGKIHNYYKCADKTKKSGCNKANERKEYIERLVTEAAVEAVSKPGVIENIAKRIVKIIEREQQENNHLEHLNRELSETQKKIGNLIKFIEKGIAEEEVQERLDELTYYKQDLLLQIKQESIKLPNIEKEQMIYFLQNSVKQGNLDDSKYQEKIIDMLVNKVYIYDTDNGGKKIIVYCNTNENTNIEISDIPTDINDDFEPIDTNQKNEVRIYDTTVGHKEAMKKILPRKSLDFSRLFLVFAGEFLMFDFVDEKRIFSAITQTRTVVKPKTEYL